jgi:hypothetical protein
MKAFIIIPNTPKSKTGMLLSVISAFVPIESTGVAEDAVEALGIIRQRYPDVLIFSSRILEENGHGYLQSVLKDGDSFVMMPKHGRFKDRCTYIGFDFSFAKQKEWVLNKLGETLRQYQHLTAK